MSLEQVSHAHMEAFVALLATHAHLVRGINRCLQESGLISLEVFDILIALECSEGRRARMSELSEQSLLSPSGITRLVDRLERLGYVRRESNSSDRRSTYAVLTDSGQQARENAWPRYREIMSELFESRLNVEEAQVLTALMRKYVVKLPCLP